MITKENFITLLESNSAISDTEKEEISEQWEGAMDAAISAEYAMPGIGFASPTQRINAFISVCRHLDQMMGRGEIDIVQSQLAINILRLSSRKFKKAAMMFDLRSDRFNAASKVELPESALKYLAGIAYTGR